MNLINFAKQNIKISRSIIVFLLSIIPLLNCILLYSFIKDDINYIITFNSLETITFIFAFIFSITIAYSLNKFLFKQKNLDFYLSLPISKKKIFISNIISGIILILILLFINTLVIILFKYITGMLLPNKLIFDYFIYNLILYIFIYALITLSIYISPNFIVSLILFIIICFSYPSITIFDKTASELYTNLYIEVDSKKIELDYYKNINTSLTLPSSYILKNSPETKDFIKTIILSITYVFLGYFAFKNKKFEENINITNEKIHYIIKTITLIPFAIVFAFSIKEYSSLISIIILIISIIYYIIYDIFTKKPFYKPFKSSIVFTWSFVILTLVTFTIFNFYSKERVLDLEGISTENIYNTNLYTKIDNIDYLYNSLNNSEESFATKFKTSDNKYFVIIHINKELLDYIDKLSQKEYLNYLSKEDFKKINYMFYEEIILDKNILNYENTSNLDTSYLLNTYIYDDYKYTNINIPFEINDITFNNLNNYLKKLFKEAVKDNSSIDITYPDNNDLFKCVYSNKKDELINYLLNNNQSGVLYSNIYYEDNNKKGILFINDPISFNNFLESYNDLCYNKK